MVAETLPPLLISVHDDVGGIEKPWLRQPRNRTATATWKLRFITDREWWRRDSVRATKDRSRRTWIAQRRFPGSPSGDPGAAAQRRRTCRPWRRLLPERRSRARLLPRQRSRLTQRGIGTLDRIDGKLIGGAAGIVSDRLAGAPSAMVGVSSSHRQAAGFERQGRRCPCPATAAVALSLVGARRGAP